MEHQLTEICEKLCGQLLTMLVPITVKLAAVEQRLSALEQRFVELDRRVDELENPIDMTYLPSIN